MKREGRSQALLFAAACFVASSAGCDGNMGSPDRPGASARGGAAGAGGANGGPGGVGSSVGGAGAQGAECDGAYDAARLPPRLILLSDYQQLGSLKALLGPTALSAADTEEHTAQTKPFTQKGVVVNASLVHGRMAWAQTATASLDARFDAFTGCMASRPDDACAARFLRGFAARAFRRPVADDELSDLMAVYQLGKTQSFSNGLKRAVEAVLGAPSFMYRRELGVANGKGDLSLTPHELASELSFLLSDQPPDDELARAADSGALAKDDEVTRQVERLLATRAVQDALSSTLISSWGLSNLFGTEKDPKLFPEYSPLLAAAMFHETELFVRDVLWDRKAPVSELLVSDKSFINRALATLYGVPFTGRADEFVAVTLPAQRRGLLTQASVMTTLARTDTTSVVARGLFVRGALLCLPKVMSPPASLSTQIEELLKADMSERQRAEVRAQNGTCSGCHRGIDPFGLLLEQYDPLGKFRTTLKNVTIDASSEVEAGSLSGKYQDALSFITAAASSPEFSACVGRQLLAYATQDEALKARDCAVTALTPGDSAPNLPALIKSIALSPALRLRKPEAM